MDKDVAAQAGNALTGKTSKEEERLPDELSAKGHKNKVNKSQTGELEKTDGVVEQAQVEDATAGDDFYTDVLERFGIQI